MPIKTTKDIGFNGELVPWERATVHVMTHALHYGSSVFEGIRCYSTPKGPAIFRLGLHTRRLFDSAKIYRMELPFSAEQINQACKAVVRENGLQSAYLRPLVWRGYGELGVFPLKNPVEVMIAAVEWGTYLGADALENGVDVAVSSWSRVAPNTLPAMAKAGGNLSSQLIVMEAVRYGHAEGIALDVNGNLSEGSGENLFVIRDGVIYTPPVTAALLAGHHARLGDHAGAHPGLRSARAEPAARGAVPRRRSVLHRHRRRGLTHPLDRWHYDRRGQAWADHHRHPECLLWPVQRRDRRSLGLAGLRVTR
ncbi:MAG: branched-chain amino acid transaminase [Kouleothrix sp.]